jgi:hypothetical protein
MWIPFPFISIKEAMCDGGEGGGVTFCKLHTKSHDGVVANAVHVKHQDGHWLDWARLARPSLFPRQIRTQPFCWRSWRMRGRLVMWN